MPRQSEPIALAAARQAGLPEGRIVGTRDVAAMLGVSRQRVGQLVRDDRSFPYAVTKVSGGPLWYTAGIEIWMVAHRLTDPGQFRPFGREAADLLLAAEAVALERGDGYVGNLHLWWAMAADEASIVSRVFTTLGVDRTELHRATGLSGVGPLKRSSSVRMTPHLQRLLEAAAAAARAADRELTAQDIANGFIDGDERIHGRRSDHLLEYVARRGLDVAELRRRLARVSVDPRAIESFELRRLTKRRPVFRRPRRPPGLDLARNPLGHDPWELSWGAVFAVRRDGRSLVIDGEQWFFRTDGDGFFMRTRDGRPVGYRYRIDPPPRRGRVPRPVNGFMEALPMPPSDIAYWPDHRFEREG